METDFKFGGKIRIMGVISSEWGLIWVENKQAKGFEAFN